MKPDKLFQELKDLAEKIGIHVSEQNFRNTGIHVNSGYCKVKEKDYCIINKHLKLNNKIEVLGECVNMFSHDSIYVVPAVRAFLDSFNTTKGESEKVSSDQNDAKEFE